MKKIALVVVAVIVGIIVMILGLAATKPDTMVVERSTTIKAPPQKLVGYIEDFHAWREWSPWENIDPNMQRTYEGPKSGVGSSYA